LPQRLGFDLADAFALDGEALADFFERAPAAIRAQAEAHLDDLLLAEVGATSPGELLEFKCGYSIRPYVFAPEAVINFSALQRFPREQVGFMGSSSCISKKYFSDFYISYRRGI
jgi:hypothetical protein